MFAATSLFINILPGLMVEDFARRAPAARPLLEQWVTDGVSEQHLYGQDDLTFIDASYPLYSTGTVYAGGVVAYLGYLNPNPTMVCEMASTRLTDCFGTARGTEWNDHSGIELWDQRGCACLCPDGRGRFVCRSERRIRQPGGDRKRQLPDLLCAQQHPAG